jgi:hypothetical protein
MADKRISQLVERTDIANNDVVPIVASGATTTNKATISSIQEFMQENLDLGVTSVGITLGTTGTDVSVSGSPITTSGNITINLPTASATNRGLLSAADWTTFNNKQAAGNYVTLDTAQTITAQKVFTTSGSSDSVIISHGSGNGFALDVIKAGNNEAIRVTKTSGSGNAMSITGGNFSAEAANFSGVVTTTPDAVINGVNVGRGGGSVSTNTRIGFGSLGSNTSGSENTSVGYLSLQNNTVGGSNTVLGYGSMTANTSGTQNIAIGNTTFVSNTTGNTNIAIGGQAGRYTSSAAANTNSSNSIFIGYDTRASADSQANQIVIGHNAIGNGSNTVTIGNSSITNTYLRGTVQLTDTGTASSINIISDSTGNGAINIEKNTSGTGIRVTNNGVGEGIFTNNTSTGSGITIGNASTGKGLIIANATGASGDPFVYTLGGAAFVKAKIDYLGNFTAVGATLTGALNGTSASFSGKLSVTQASTDFVAEIVNTQNATPYGLRIKDAASGANGYPLLSVSNNSGSVEYFRVNSGTGAATFSSSVKSSVASGGSVITSESTATNGEGQFVILGKNSSGTVRSGSFKYDNADILRLGTSSPIDFRFETNDTERMRITSGGDVNIGLASNYSAVNVYLGTATNGSTGQGGQAFYGGPQASQDTGHESGTASGSNYHRFILNGSVIGSITQLGVSAVLYNTSSDYRLKEDLQEIQGIEKIQAIKVYNYKWKADESRMDGVLAHELSEVLPYAVHGEKDAVDEEGNDIMQGVDYSKIVPILIKAIQELKAEIDSLKTK